MQINDYQTRAMSTCLPACSNHVYMINGLTAEVGEINDKIAKWVRKGIARFDDNRLVFNTSDPAVRDAYVAELMSELGDVTWFVAGLAQVCGVPFEEVSNGNLAKLANRKKEGTIITHTDH